jgi:hypothetical protein
VEAAWASTVIAFCFALRAALRPPLCWLRLWHRQRPSLARLWHPSQASIYASGGVGGHLSPDLGETIDIFLLADDSWTGLVSGATVPGGSTGELRSCDLRPGR